MCGNVTVHPFYWSLVWLPDPDFGPVTKLTSRLRLDLHPSRVPSCVPAATRRKHKGMVHSWWIVIWTRVTSRSLCQLDGVIE
jgi:hypothetical protein